EGKIHELRFGTNDDELLYLLESPTLPTELYCFNTSHDLENRITTFHEERMFNIHPSQHEVESFDGIKIKFFLYEGLKEHNRNKCILYIHGGPEIQERYTYNAYFQYLVHEGYSVCVPNVRGSTGYGKTFEKLDNGSNRLNCLQDLLAVNKWLIDTKNYETGLMGRSYGAYLELLALTHMPAVWKYGISIAGFMNLNTFLQGLSTASRNYRGFEYGSLDMYGEFHENVAPLHNVANIQAPILMFHGDKDNVVPVSESIQFAHKMQKSNRQVTFFELPNEGHKVQKASNQKFVAKEINHFLSKIYSF
ncbi:MAG: prolyl oligopeptidase family serine peptidase, partial [Lysinibacillus sp.]